MCIELALCYYAVLLRVSRLAHASCGFFAHQRKTQHARTTAEVVVENGTLQAHGRTLPSPSENRKDVLEPLNVASTRHFVFENTTKLASTR